MKTNLTTACLNNSIMSKLDLGITITENKLNLPLSALFTVAARKNPKRNFLFVSKVLGKHLPLKPQVPILIGKLLADCLQNEIHNKDISFYSKELASTLLDCESENPHIDLPSIQFEIDKPTLFIGFAETATGLGHSVYANFKGNIGFIHTTRDNILDIDRCFEFEESHSHATTHRCFSEDVDFFNHYERIVLIDDEVTTGNTSMNLIKSMSQKFKAKEFINMAILDWRDPEKVEEFNQLGDELGASVSCLSLVKGVLDYTHKPLDWVETSDVKETDGAVPLYSSINLEDLRDNQLESEKLTKQTIQTKVAGQGIVSYYLPTGRFGLVDSKDCHWDTDETCLTTILNKKRLARHNDLKDIKTLCVGFEEFIYLPALVANTLFGNVYYQSATRSPIYTSIEDGYPITDKIAFENPYEGSYTNYLYNIGFNKWDEIIIFFERKISDKDKEILVDLLKQRGVKYIEFVVFTRNT